MALPTAAEITNLYLYAQKDTPKNLVDEKLIRPKNIPDKDLPSVDVNTQEFMKDGGGRFAVGRQFDLVKYFFMSDNNKLPPNTPEKPFYTKKEIADKLCLTSYEWAMQQYNYQDGKDDYAQRSYIYNSQVFQIADDAKFIVKQDGAKQKRSIEDFAIIPRKDKQENFDFASSSLVAKLANALIEPKIDPSRIGRKVLINFTGDVTRTTYDRESYDNDLATMNKWGGFDPIKLDKDVNKLIKDLWDFGVTKFLDKDAPDGRPIIYGTNGADNIDLTMFNAPDKISTSKAPPINPLYEKYPNLFPYAKNGVVLVTGKGADTLSNAPVNSVALGGADADKYVVTADKLGVGKIPLTIADPSPEDRISLATTAITGTAKKAGDGWVLNDYILKKSGNDLTISNAKAETIAVVNNFKSGDMGIVLDEAVVKPTPVPSNLPTMLEMTNLYLYGQKTTPANKVDGSLIRPRGATNDNYLDKAAKLG